MWKKCVLGVALACLLVPARARAETSELTCVDAAAQALAACPAEAKPSKVSRRSVGLASQKKAGEKAKTGPPPPPPVPDDERDRRNAQKKLRSLSLLIQETNGLEGLLRRTAKTSPDHLGLAKRLADDYAEIEAVSRGQKDRAERDVARFGKKDPARANRARADRTRFDKTLRAARKNAIQKYERIVGDHGSYAKLDEILYYLAYEYEQAGDLGRARKTYLSLIEKAPTSPWVPRAYLAFGELFYQEAMGDPSKWALAEQAYREASKAPPPGNTVYGIARYKLGYVHWNQGDLPSALSELKRVIEWGRANPTAPGAGGLSRAALRDSVAVYASSGAAERAFGFFGPLAADAPGKTERLVGLMNELGIAYLDVGRYAEAITLYRDLLRKDPGTSECRYQAQIVAATQAQKSADKESISGELGRLFQAREALRKRDAPAEVVLACDNRTAEVASETAMAWHLEAIGSGGVRGTNDSRTMDRASELYAKLLSSFQAKDFARFTFPRFERADWPSYGKLAYARADLAYARGKWAECATAFDQVFASNPRGVEAAESAYAALLCYQKLRDQTRSRRSDRTGRGLAPGAELGTLDALAPRPIDALDQKMLAAFDRYLCWVDPSSLGEQGKDQHVEVEFARARTYYEAQHWAEAAAGFRHIALEHSSHEAGIYAAQLYLEALNVLANRSADKRTACIESMGKDVTRFSALYCRAPSEDMPAGQCELLARVEVGVERTRLEAQVKAADALPPGSPSALELYRKAGDGYLSLFRRHCEGPLEKAEKPKPCEGAAEILTNMARAYQAGRLLARAMQARTMLLDERYGLAKSELGKRALYDLGANYQSIAAYDRAAEHYERFVDASCAGAKCGKDADRALLDAALLRLGLGAADRALEDADKYERWFGKKKAAEAAQLRFAIAAHFAERQSWDEVRARLAKAMPSIDAQAKLDVRLAAHALFGKALHELRRDAAAATEYQRVLALWAEPQRAAADIRASEADADVAERKLGRSLEAVGEALFFFAERKRERAEAMRFPVYRGPGTQAAVMEHIATRVKPWVLAKRPLLDEATREYRKIADLVPAAPPRSVIQSGSRVGEMWGTFVKEFRRAPIPDSIRKDPELRAAYYAELDRLSEPQKLLAKSAYETCLSYSVKYQYWDAASRTCEEWLAREYKGEYHLIDEFRGAPTRRNGPEAERPLPIRLPWAR